MKTLIFLLLVGMLGACGNNRKEQDLRKEITQLRSELEKQRARAKVSLGRREFTPLQRADVEQASALATLDESLEEWLELREGLDRDKLKKDEAAIKEARKNLKEKSEFCLKYLQAVEEAQGNLWTEVATAADFAYGPTGGQAERIAIQAYQESFAKNGRQFVHLRQLLTRLFQEAL